MYFLCYPNIFSKIKYILRIRIVLDTIFIKEGGREGGGLPSVKLLLLTHTTPSVIRV